MFLPRSVRAAIATRAPFAPSLIRMVAAALVGALAVTQPLHAQHGNGNGNGGGSGGTGGGGITPDCVSGCGSSWQPDVQGPSSAVVAKSSTDTVSYTVYDIGTTTGSYTFTCGHTGGTGCVSVSPTSATLSPSGGAFAPAQPIDPWAPSIAGWGAEPMGTDEPVYLGLWVYARPRSLYPTQVTVRVIYTAGTSNGSVSLTADGSGGAIDTQTTTVSLRYNVAVTPDGSTTPTRGDKLGGYPDTFTVQNTGVNSATFNLSCSALSPSVCRTVAPTSITLSAGATGTVIVTDSIAPISTTATGRITLTATGTGSATGVSDAGYVNVAAAHLAVAVTPDGGSAELAKSSNGTLQFVVKNVGYMSETIGLACAGSGGMGCTNPGSRTLAVGDSSVVGLAVSTGATEGAEGVTLTGAVGHASDNGSYTVQVVHYSVAVAPDSQWEAHPRVEGASGADTFIVHNTSSGSTSQQISLACTGNSRLTCTSGSLGTVSLAPGDSALVVSAYTTTVTGSSGSGMMTLTATMTNHPTVTAEAVWWVDIWPAAPAHGVILGSTLSPDPVPTESGPFSYTISVTNDRGGTDPIHILCGSASPQLLCTTPSPSSISIAPGDTATVNVGYTTLGIGTFAQKLWVSLGDEATADDSIVSSVTVAGTPIATHMAPLDGAPAVFEDSLVSTLYDTAGVDSSSFRSYIDGVDRAAWTTARTGSRLVLSIPDTGLFAGVHSWATYGCAFNGRCDSTTTTFVYQGPRSAWELDDSLPRPAYGEITQAGILGPLPLPPDSLRGCPVSGGYPEITLNAPPTIVPQQQEPFGRVFLAGLDYEVGDSLEFTTTTIDHADTSSVTCGDYGYLGPDDFNWGAWQGVDSADVLWAGYAYSDRAGLGFLASLGPVFGGAAYASLSTRDYPKLALSGGPRVDFGHWVDLWADASRTRRGDHATAARRRSRSARSGGRSLGEAISRLFVGDAGAINVHSFTLVLNGDTLIADSTGRSGASIVQLTKVGAVIHLWEGNSHLNKYDANDPTNHPGWNELIASIADSGGHRTAIRARFVMVGAGPYETLALTPLRDFSHGSEGDCAAFGAVQCGGTFLTQTIPGFTTRDRNRALHLVYRSQSQKAATILPFEMKISRLQHAPDSLWVYTRTGAVRLSDTLRYAGTHGGDATVYRIWENANEDRVLGADLPAAAGEAAIRPVTIGVHGFYGIDGQHDDSLTQEVVQLRLTDTASTRFGQGWQLAELDRLILGQTSLGLPAALWVSGDGSYTIFRQDTVSGVWLTPAGETARLTHPATQVDSAAYVLYLDNGASIGFRADGWQAWTGDLLGNHTRYHYASGTSSRLTSITDPTGMAVLFRYSGATVSRVLLQGTGGSGDTTVVATLGYADAATAPKLSQVKIWHSASAGDSTRFTYLAADSMGAFVDSVIDPRSKSGHVIATALTYDGVLSWPEQLTHPLNATSTATTLVRHPYRRAVPRPFYGRGVPGSGSNTQPLERTLYLDQYRGTTIDVASRPMDFMVDRFGAPMWVRQIAPEPIMHQDFSFTTFGGDVVRTIARDSLGRVLKIVQDRDSTAISDSLMYHYDALGRVDTLIRTTLAYPDSVFQLDTLRFTYDSVSVATGGAWCSRLKSSIDPMGAVTNYQYGASGAAQCLVSKVIGPANDTTDVRLHDACRPATRKVCGPPKRPTRTVWLRIRATTPIRGTPPRLRHRVVPSLRPIMERWDG